ncbi:MAG: acetylxylan esterase [Armatimonadetes bacterium]|nr:acetylxylan esterase [Armatimonadota bacterium]MDE2207639.1 acetylxylan esterase [Armatimonadota bacterium]
MPLIDMPLDQLLTYEGRNPRPADHAAYWDTALAEMRATKPEPVLHAVPNPSSAVEAFDLTFTGVGGSRIYAKYMRPARIAGPRPAVLMFHGYSGSSGDWLEKVAYAASGYCVAAMDCRGQGGRSEDLGGTRGNTLRGHIIRGLDDEPSRMLYRQIFLDTAQLARVVMEFDEVDATRVGATGASQGGGLTLACAALTPEIRRAAPVYPFLCDYQRVWEMDLATNAYDELRTWFRMFDPTHARQDEIFLRLGYIDVQHLADRIKAQVCMITGLMDTICPPSTQYAAFNKMRCEKDVLIYPDFGHEGIPGAGDRCFEFLAGL